MNKKQLMLAFTILFLFLSSIYAQGKFTAKGGRLGFSVPFGKRHHDYNNIRIVKVIDGDDLRLENGERVRLIGIDCPEGNTEEGRRAAEFTKKLAQGKIVRLEFDAEKKDKYARLLAYVYVLCTRFNKENDSYEYNELISSMVFLNAEIIKQGYAKPMTILPNIKYRDLFKKLHLEAKKSNKMLKSEDSTKL